jgi:hypothetical protein
MNDGLRATQMAPILRRARQCVVTLWISIAAAFMILWTGSGDLLDLLALVAIDTAVYGAAMALLALYEWALKSNHGKSAGLALSILTLILFCTLCVLGFFVLDYFQAFAVHPCGPGEQVYTNLVYDVSCVEAPAQARVADVVLIASVLGTAYTLRLLLHPLFMDDA